MKKKIETNLKKMFANIFNETLQLKKFQKKTKNRKFFQQFEQFNFDNNNEIKQKNDNYQNDEIFR